MAWYDEIFDGLYDRFTFHLFTKERNWQEAEFIRTSLQLMPGQKVLDLACGYGRHAIPLARKGINITGMDSCERYLRMAREKAEGLPLRFVEKDMRKMEFLGEFDAVYCFFTSFGFFDDETNFDVLRRVASALRPGGRFLLDIQNKELYGAGEPGHQEFSEFERDGKRLALLSKGSFDPDSGRVSITLSLYGEPDGPLRMEFSIRLYSLPELRWLLKQAGMAATRTFGGSDASPYRIDSPRLIVVAEKS